MPQNEQNGAFSIESVTFYSAPLTIAISDTSGRPISQNQFRVASLQGQESVSQLYEFTVQLYANDSSNTSAMDIQFDQLLGQPVTISFVLPNTLPANTLWESVPSDIPRRYFSGIVADFSYSEPGSYQLTIKPALWKTTLTNRYQLYSSKTIQAVLEEVLGNHNIEYKMYLDSVAIDREQDWIQTGETDFEFIQRLMKKANIYYYFEHHNNDHCLVLANQPQYLPLTVPGKQDKLTLKYTHSSEPDLHSQEDEHISSYQYKKSVSQTGVHSILVRSEAAWESDNIAGFSKYEATHNDVYRLPFRECKVYQYGGSASEVQITGGKQWEMIQTAATSLSGGSTSPLLSAGHTVLLANSDSEAPAYDFNSGAINGNQLARPELENKEFVITQVQHKVSATEPYSNQFQATESSGLVTDFNIQDTQQGMILGTVVADETASAPNGWKYYKKSNFYSEPHTARDLEGGETLQEIGVFVQLATDSMANQGPIWVKLAQHMQTVPEVGVTVSIGRSNDESEMPEVQSIVQANGSKNIMPSRWSANTSVGSNYSTSYGDSKSIRFGLHSTADLDKAITIVENAYNTKKFKDSSYSQGAGYSYSTAEKGKDGLLSESESYGSTVSKYYGASTESYSEIGDSKSESKIDYSYSQSTIGDTDSYTTITGKSYSKSKIGQQESDTTITGSNKSTTQINGATTNNTTHNGNISNTTVINANQTSFSQTTGTSDNQSQTYGAASNMNMFLGAKNNMDLNIAASNNMAVNASLSNDMAVNVGLHVNSRVDLGLNLALEINGSIDLKKEIKLLKVDSKTTPLEVITEPANVKARIGNIDVEIMTFKIFM